MYSHVKTAVVRSIHLVKSFGSNARACVVTEPMWAIPFNLYITYTSLYMLELGCTPTEVGLITAAGLASQMLFSLLGGYITDHLGRRRTSLIFDILAWSIPTLIWAAARNFHFFLVAALLNGVVRVVHNSWSCLFVEDTPPEQRVHVFTWIAVATVLSGFFAPIGGIIVAGLGLVDAVRLLYLVAFVSMTSMIFIRNAMVHETAVGLQRMAEVRGHGLAEVLGDYGRVAKDIVRDRGMIAAIALGVLSISHITVRNTFLGIVLARGVGLPQAAIAAFPALASAITVVIYLFITPHLPPRRLDLALALGLLSAVVGNLVLLAIPAASFAGVTVATFFTAFGTALILPLVETKLANRVSDKDRAKTMSFAFMLMFGLSAPFGYLAGIAAQVNPRLPSAVIAGILTAALAILGASHRRQAPPR